MLSNIHKKVQNTFIIIYFDMCKRNGATSTCYFVVPNKCGLVGATEFSGAPSHQLWFALNAALNFNAIKLVAL